MRKHFSYHFARLVQVAADVHRFFAHLVVGRQYVGHHYGLHSRSVCRAYAVVRVLYGYRLGGVCAQLFAGGEVNIGRGLAVLSQRRFTETELRDFLASSYDTLAKL